MKGEKMILHVDKDTGLYIDRKTGAIYRRIINPKWEDREKILPAYLCTYCGATFSGTVTPEK